MCFCSDNRMHFQNDTLHLYVIHSIWSNQWNKQAELCLTSSRMRLDVVLLCLQTAPPPLMRTASGQSCVTEPQFPGAPSRLTWELQVCCCCRCSFFLSSPNTRWWSPLTSGLRTGRHTSSQLRSKVQRVTALPQRWDHWNTSWFWYCWRSLKSCWILSYFLSEKLLCESTETMSHA